MVEYRTIAGAGRDLAARRISPVELAQASLDRIAAEIDHQVNVKAEIKTGLIVSRLDDLEREMHALHDQQIKAFNECK